jgi:aminoglycoside phosphotransferase (APT) family kinase protein
VALTVQRDLDALIDGVTAWLSARHGTAVEVRRAERPTDGWSSETLLLWTDHGDVAVRLAPTGPGIFPSYDLGLQARAQAVAAAAGVPAAVPAEVVDDPSWLGDPFLAMPLVGGNVPGEMATFDPWLLGLPAAARARAYESVVDALADLHATDPTGVGLPRRSVSDELAWWADYLAWADLGVPALDAALTRCADTRPAGEPPAAVLWGDVRLGNVVLADDGSVACLLDWEMATVGAPEHDLGWWWGLEALQDDLVGTRASGFPTLDDLRRRYEARAGRVVQDLDWYASFARFRSAAILTRIGRLQEQAGVPTRMPVADNPVLDHLAGRPT